MKTQTEIKKGCGKVWFGDDRLEHSCGFDILCTSCQSLLAQSQEFVEMIDKMIYDLKEANAINNVAGVLALNKLELQKAEALKIIITSKRAILQELKSAIIGEDKTH